MATIQELKDMLIEEKLKRAEEHIPTGHCPYAYYTTDESTGCELDMSCGPCRNHFFKMLRKQITEEVNAL